FSRSTTDLGCTRRPATRQPGRRKASGLRTALSALRTHSERTLSWARTAGFPQKLPKRLLSTSHKTSTSLRGRQGVIGAQGLLLPCEITNRDKYLAPEVSATPGLPLLTGGDPGRRVEYYARAADAGQMPT